MLCPGDCSCSDFVNNEHGKCKTKSNNQLFCYVNQPSDCPDLQDSAVGNGIQFSVDACRAYQGKRYKYQKSVGNIVLVRFYQN